MLLGRFDKVILNNNSIAGNVLNLLKNVMDQVGDRAPARNRYFQTQLFKRFR